MTYLFAAKIERRERIDPASALRKDGQNPNRPGLDEVVLGPAVDDPCLWRGCWNRRGQDGLCRRHALLLRSADPLLRALARSHRNFYRQLIHLNHEEEIARRTP